MDPLSIIMTIENLTGPFDKYGTFRIMMDEAAKKDLITYEEWLECDNYLRVNRGFPRNVVDAKILDNIAKLNGATQS